MQVIVKRSALTPNAKNIRVIASYEDNVAVDPSPYGKDIAVLSVTPNAIILSHLGMTLADNWQELQYKAK